MPFGSGRKSAAEWAHIEEIESDKLKVMCRHCTAPISKKIESVMAHLRKCNNLTICCTMKNILVIQVAIANAATRDSSSSSSSTPILGSNLSAVTEMERSYPRANSDHLQAL